MEAFGIAATSRDVPSSDAILTILCSAAFNSMLSVCTSVGRSFLSFCTTWSLVVRTAFDRAGSETHSLDWECFISIDEGAQKVKESEEKQEEMEDCPCSDRDCEMG